MMLGQRKVHKPRPCLEKLLFSDKIKKINMYSWTQERYFVITSEKVYNVKKSKIKRSIQVRSSKIDLSR